MEQNFSNKANVCTGILFQMRSYQDVAKAINLTEQYGFRYVNCSSVNKQGLFIDLKQRTFYYSSFSHGVLVADFDINFLEFLLKQTTKNGVGTLYKVATENSGSAWNELNKVNNLIVLSDIMSEKGLYVYTSVYTKQDFSSVVYPASYKLEVVLDTITLYEYFYKQLTTTKLTAEIVFEKKEEIINVPPALIMKYYQAAVSNKHGLAELIKREFPNLYLAEIPVKKDFVVYCHKQVCLDYKKMLEQDFPSFFVLEKYPELNNGQSVLASDDGIRWAVRTFISHLIFGEKKYLVSSIDAQEIHVKYCIPLDKFPKRGLPIRGIHY